MVPFECVGFSMLLVSHPSHTNTAYSGNPCYVMRHPKVKIILYNQYAMIVIRAHGRTWLNSSGSNCTAELRGSIALGSTIIPLTGRIALLRSAGPP